MDRDGNVEFSILDTIRKETQQDIYNVKLTKNFIVVLGKHKISVYRHDLQFVGDMIADDGIPDGSIDKWQGLVAIEQLNRLVVCFSLRQKKERQVAVMYLYFAQVPAGEAGTYQLDDRIHVVARSKY